ncbi:hypothetical protein L1787_15400 [Acuticoccus sp. M5D2P5]|uniref:hypothetical protein n=1 Tax=Acuticoccus kalidii TaxID=2910977 RepID=UPI001F273BA6|nr:hypothetical protein [Acuticoccus kalidii]MCF3934788.1 hypothetical protein [Acuticoccus kalidii]
MSEVARILIGPLVWLALFTATYALHGIACSQAWYDVDALGLSLMRVVLLAAWLATIAVAGAILLALLRPPLGSRSPFVRTVSLATAATGLVAAVWTLFPVATNSICMA